MRFTFADQIGFCAASHPQRTAIEVIGGPSLTYAALWQRVGVLSRAIVAAVDGQRACVGVLLPNGADVLAVLFACQRAGVIAVPVNPRFTAAEVEFVLSDSRARVLVSGSDRRGLAGEVAGRLGIEVLDVEDLDVAAGGGDDEMPPTRATDPVLVAYTSGTTGFPKGVINTLEGLWAMVMRRAAQLSITESQVMLVPGPLCHTSYAGNAMMQLMAGGRVRVMRAFDAGVACDELDGEATWAFLVPSMTAMMLQEWKARGRPPLRSARTILSSGASLPLPVLQDALQMFPNCQFSEAYGWAEAYGLVAHEVKDRNDLRAHSVGWPSYGYEVVVLDEQGRKVPPGQHGQVAARGLVPFAGYLHRPDAAREAEVDGYVLSGDIGFIAEDGRLSIVDRKPDMIVSGGENVYSAEVERVLAEHPDVVEAAVVGRPDPTWGEVVVAVVVRSHPALDPPALDAHCRARMAGYKCPKAYVVVDDPGALPRNAMGKVQKFRLREEVIAGSGAMVAVPVDGSGARSPAGRP